MIKTFTNKNEYALILGGSSGLGLATAHKLSREGLNLIIIHRDRRGAMEVFQQQTKEMEGHGVHVLSYNIDATRADKRADLLQGFAKENPHAKIKVLIHSLSRGNLKPMIGEADESTLTNDDFHITLQAMAISLYDWVQNIYNTTLFAADSRVIAFTSEGNQKAWQNYGAVSAAKAALESIARNIALEYAPAGIRCNCIQAGVTITPSLNMIPNHENIIAHTLTRNPYHRLTTPEDVANAVYLLCREEAKWINGVILPVDGGEKII